MYTHARQFPHFAGMTDSEIIGVVRRAMAKNPRYFKLRRVQVVLAALLIVATLVGAIFAGLELDFAFVAAGAVSTLAILGWNLVWINTALYRITAEEIQTG
jgi:hypothetical protein